MRRSLLPWLLLVLAGCSRSERTAYCEQKCACERCDVDDCVRSERLMLTGAEACEAAADAFHACAREHGECTDETPEVSYWVPGERCEGPSRQLNGCLREHRGSPFEAPGADEH